MPAGPGSDAAPSRPLLLALTIAMALAVVASGTAAAAPAPVEITSPGADALRTGSVVTVRLRTAAGQPGLRVTAYGRGDRLRNLTGRFRRVGPRRYVAHLRVGRDLRVGRNHIFAEVRGGAVGEAHFTVARQAGRLLAVRRIERGRSERPPLDLRVRVAQGATLLVRLNGRNARRSFEEIRPGVWDADLSVKDGLRFGRNRVVVTAFTESGRFRRERLTFTVRRGRPLADAGHDVVTRGGAQVQLDGRRTLGDRRSPRLRWRVVRKPRGSHPRLSGATGERPRLVTDRSGTYRIELRADHPVRATAAQVPGATDTVEVAAQPNVLPAGVPVETIATQGSDTGVRVGSSFYPIGLPNEKAIQMVVLDRSTLQLQANSTFAIDNEQGLLNAVKAVTNSSFVILSGAGRGPYDLDPPLAQAIGAIGGVTNDPTLEEAPVWNFGEFGDGNWSIIGIPGLVQGHAYQLFGLRQSMNTPVGDMRGNFQRDAGGSHFAFNWTPENRTFDTSVGSTPVLNTMNIDGTNYSSFGLPFPGRTGLVGFQLLWFDADSLQLRDTVTFDADPLSSFDDALNLSPGSEHGMWGMRDFLRRMNADGNPGLLFVNTVGNVPTLFFQDHLPGKDEDGNDARGDVAARVATLLEMFGANRYVYLGFGQPGGGPGTPGGYAFVGATGLRYLRGPNGGAEVSTKLQAGTVARLAGVLSRNRQGVLLPSSTDSPNPGAATAAALPNVQQLVTQPDEPFTSFADGGPLAAAEQYIAAQLQIPVDPQFGIRGNYWQNSSIDWNGRRIVLDNMTPCAASPCAAGFATVKQTLDGEFSDLAQVRPFFKRNGDLGALFSSVFLDSSFGLTAVQNEIRNLYDPPVAPAEGPDGLSIFADSLGLEAAIGGFFPESEGAVSGLLLISSLVTLIEHTTTKTGGESVFDPYGFRSTTADLATDLGGAFDTVQDSITRAGDLLVSDRGRLRTAAQLILKPAGSDANSGWGLGGTNSAVISGRLRQTMRQFMWLTLSQPVLATYECADQDGSGLARRHPDSTLIAQINYPEWRPRGTSAWNLYYTNIILGLQHHYGTPSILSPGITSRLFGAPDFDDPTDDSVGFLKEYFFNRAMVRHYTPDTDGDPYFDDNGGPSQKWGDKTLVPASPGLIHKNQRFSDQNVPGDGPTEPEKGWGLSERTDWSAYTPSCGYGTRINYSDPDPLTTPSRDWITNGTPYANP